MAETLPVVSLSSFISIYTGTQGKATIYQE